MYVKLWNYLGGQNKLKILGVAHLHDIESGVIKLIRHIGRNFTLQVMSHSRDPIVIT